MNERGKKKSQRFVFLLKIYSFRVIAKSEGESIAAKFSCAFCETTAADDYEYVQQLFHRAVREVRKERERVVASNTIDEEPSDSVHFTITPESPSSPIPLPPPMPATLAHKATKLNKPESQSSPHIGISQICIISDIIIDK